MTEKSKSIIAAMRMVHINNIPHILKYGITHRNSVNADKNYIQIGDNTLIESRIEWKIPNSNFNLGEYIPFYFGPRTPMLYEIQKGNKNVTKRNPEEIIYCIILIKDVINHALEGYFTDGHAKSAITKFYTNDHLKELNSLVNRKDVYERNWGITYDNTGETKRKKSAELLLKNDLSPDYIKWFVVYNEKAKNTLLEYGVNKEKILINKNFYF